MAKSTAVRLRRPRWRDPRVIIGAVLVLAALLGTWQVVRAAGQTTTVWAAKSALVPGSVIGEADIVAVEVRLPEGSSAYVVTEKKLPSGTTVSAPVRAGELIPAKSLVSPDKLQGRVMALAITDPLPAAVQSGSHVDVWAAGKEEGSTPRQILASVPVTAVKRDDGGFAAERGTRIEVFIPTDSLSDVLQSVAADQRLAVVAVPDAASTP